MIRKTLIALAAAAAIGTVALAPTAASAKHFGFNGFNHHHHNGLWGLSFFNSDVVYDDCYWVKKPTRYGYGYKLIQVCS
jgi:hypothetical protein